MPNIDLTCNIREDGYLAVFISNCSSTGFTLQAEIPEGANYKPKKLAKSIYQTFLDYLDGLEVSDQLNRDAGE